MSGRAGVPVRVEKRTKIKAMVLTLIGYRGTGKSSVAPVVASSIKWAWIDADCEIERVAGATIREIFERSGEAEFRRIERQVMSELLRRERTVIAAGGGAVLDDETRREMQSAGPVVWLTAEVDTIAERLMSDPTSGQRRPELTVESEKDEIRMLVARREPVYRDAATVTIDTEGKAIDTIASEILCATGMDLNGSQNDSP